MRTLLMLGMFVTAVGAGEGTLMAASPTDLSAQNREQNREIDDAVCADYLRASAWNAVWATTFAVTAVGSASVATLAPRGWIDSDSRAGLYVTASKATIGVVAKLLDPLGIDVEGLCHDPHPASVKVRRASLLDAAHRERHTLILNILGGLAINTAGLLYLGYGRGAWETAWVSFGVGNAVSVASTLTAPVHSWFLNRRLDRSHHVVVVPVIGGGRTYLALTGTW